MTREALLARTMVDLADSLVDDFDIVDLLTTLVDKCVEVLDVAAAGILLAAPSGELRLVASSEAAMRRVELFQVQMNEGPCVDCFRSGEPVVNQDLAAGDERWPRFAAVAVNAGFLAADAIPMRLRGTVIGAVNLFQRTTGSLTDDDVSAAQALADVATIAILSHRRVADIASVNDQLSGALESRIIIEQAKGIIAERWKLPLDEAFARLRSHARSNNRRLAELSRDVVDGRDDLGDDAAGAGSTPSRKSRPDAGVRSPRIGDTRDAP